MALSIGGSPVTAIYLGSTAVTALMLGSDEVWPGSVAALFQSLSADGFTANYTAPTTIDPLTGQQPFTVTSEGFSATASPVSVTRDLLVTVNRRQLNPNFALDEPNKAAVSHRIYATDTIAGGVTNNSTLVSPKPIAKWRRTDRRIVGDTIPKEWMEVSAYHINGVACVEWTISDGTSSVVVRASSPIVFADPTDKRAVIGYRPAADVSVAGLTDVTLLNVNVKVYPKVGVSASVMDSATGTLGWQFRDMKFYRNVALFTAPTYAYVSAAGNDLTAVVSTDPAAARAAPFTTYLLAKRAIQTANGGIEGAVVRLMDGTHAMGAEGSSNLGLQEFAEFVIERDPLALFSAVTLTFGTAIVNTQFRRVSDPNAQTWMRFRNLQIQRSGSSGLRVSATLPIPMHVRFENCTIDTNGFAGSVFETAVITGSVEGMTITAAGAYTWLGPTGSAARWTLLRGLEGAGNTIDGHNLTGSVLSAPATGGLTVGLNFVTEGAEFTGSNAMVDGCRFVDCGTVVSLAQSASASPVDGLALVNLEMEVSRTASVRVFRIGGELSIGEGGSGGANTSHVLLWNITQTGVVTSGSNNIGYTPSPGQTHDFWSVVGFQVGQIAVKANAFYNNGEGGEALVHGVDCQGNYNRYKGDSERTFRPQYWGPRSYRNPVDDIDIDVGWVNRQSVSQSYVTVGAAITAGAGGGDYRLTLGSPCEGLVEQVVPFDLDGNARAAFTASGCFRGANE